jgi:hypothetical protein
MILYLTFQWKLPWRLCDLPLRSSKMVLFAGVNTRLVWTETAKLSLGMDINFGQTFAVLHICTAGTCLNGDMPAICEQWMNACQLSITYMDVVIMWWWQWYQRQHVQKIENSTITVLEMLGAWSFKERVVCDVNRWTFKFVLASMNISILTACLDN